MKSYSLKVGLSQNKQNLFLYKNNGKLQSVTELYCLYTQRDWVHAHHFFICSVLKPLCCWVVNEFVVCTTHAWALNSAWTKSEWLTSKGLIAPRSDDIMYSVNMFCNIYGGILFCNILWGYSESFIEFWTKGLWQVGGCTMYHCTVSFSFHCSAFPMWRREICRRLVGEIFNNILRKT